jgi:hypothetical protein
MARNDKWNFAEESQWEFCWKEKLVSDQREFCWREKIVKVTKGNFVE